MDRAAIDHIDEGIAVLLVGADEREVYVPVDQLPPGVQAGDWLRVRFSGDRLEYAEVDVEETQRRRERIKAKLGRLFRQG